MIAEALVLFALPILLAAAAGWDLASFTIPNAISLIAVALNKIFGARIKLIVGYQVSSAEMLAASSCASIHSVRKLWR